MRSDDLDRRSGLARACIRVVECSFRQMREEIADLEKGGWSMTRYTLAGIAALAVLSPLDGHSTSAPSALEPDDTTSFYNPVEVDLEGWKLSVDPRLLANENEEVKDSLA